jgi:hypothetical protein
VAVPKKIRGKRARLRQRERRGLDLRPRYRQDDLPPAPDLGIVELDDPFAPAGWINPEGTLDPQARRQQARRADGTVAAGEPEWIAPPRQRIRAIARLDPLARMYKRGQIVTAQYQAARAFQRLQETATVGNMSPADPSRVKVDGGRISDPISPARVAAARRLNSVESTLKDEHGFAGLTLTRSVLTDGRSVQKAAREFGARSTLEIRSWCWLFRRCLDVLARALGLSNTTRRPPQPVQLNGDGGIPDTADASMHADAGDLADARLRQGRPNGSGE